MKRVLAVLSLVGVIAIPVTVAAQSPAPDKLRILCIAVSGPSGADTPESLTSGIKDGTIEVVSTAAECSASPTTASPTTAPPTQAAPGIVGVGSWILDDSIDPLTDARTVAVAVSSDEDSDVQFGVGCYEGQSIALISWDQYLGEGAKVQSRIDKGELQTLGWFGEDRASALIGPSSVDFAKALIGASTLIARTTSFGDDTITATFQVAGAEEALKPVREACGW